MRRLLLASICMLAQAESSAQSLSEYQVKAAFLYNFVKFVEWPAAAIDQRESITLCVLGRDPFGDALVRAVEGKTVNGHQIATRKINEVAAARSCHVLFLSASESGRAAEIIRAVQARNVLTVGEFDRFIESGGMINFVMDGQRVRFQINAKAALDAGLKISSKLLQLAAPAEYRGKN